MSQMKTLNSYNIKRIVNRENIHFSLNPQNKISCLLTLTVVLPDTGSYVVTAKVPSDCRAPLIVGAVFA